MKLLAVLRQLGKVVMYIFMFLLVVTCGYLFGTMDYDSKLTCLFGEKRRPDDGKPGPLSN